MASEPQNEQIGETAGIVWQTLQREGKMSLTQLIKKVGNSRDVTMQAVGWLAREGKVEIAATGRGRVISLR